MRKAQATSAPTRLLTILAQDPGVRGPGGILTSQIPVPIETLSPGPRGYRVHVVDVDSSTNTLFAPLHLGDDDPYEDVGTNERMLADPRFHAQNVYAIVMATLSRFELALGRRTAWGFADRGHQLKVAPHAFAEANAFYVRRDEALAFGYFPGKLGKGEIVFSCLSHDVVAHETTHALVDGLRPRFSEPSSPDQASFHEGFADAVALLSIFRLEEVVAAALQPREGNRRWIPGSMLKVDKLRDNVLISMADQMGAELQGVRGQPLRKSAELPPSKTYRDRPEYREAHRRGEVFVAAVLNGFLEIWLKRLEELREPGSKVMSRLRAVEEGANVADHLLTILIRALDYTPPVDLQFEDFLSALLTADNEVYPNDSRYGYREHMIRAFGRYGIDPATPLRGDRPGQWFQPPEVPTLARNRFESMQRDREEMFRFVWENREVLDLHTEAYTSVSSVRPSFRTGEEGFPLKETVAEYVQLLDVRASELDGLGIKAPKGMSRDTQVRLYGGGALIFDEFGRLKFHVGCSVTSAKQTRRLEELWTGGEFDERRDPALRFALLHRQRARNEASTFAERW